MFATYQFAFDYVFGQESSQEDIYNTSARAAVFSTLQVYMHLSPFVQLAGIVLVAPSVRVKVLRLSFVSLPGV